MNKIEHFPINWTNGVKITATHFFENYFNVVETIKNGNLRSLNNFNYGIGEKIEGSNSCIEIETIRKSNTSIIVRLKSCNAITKSGYHVLYYDGLYGDEAPSLTIDVSDIETKDESRFYVVASVNPYNLVPVGMPDPEVIPLHHPYVLPKIELYTLSENQVNASFLKENFLITGEVIIKDNILALNGEFIPPVQKTCYNEPLNNFLLELVHSLHCIKKYSILVFRKNINSSRKNEMAEKTFFLCKDVNTFYSQYIFYLENIAGQETPIRIVQTMSVLANYLSVSLDLMSEKERESLLQYYYEWSDIKPSDLTQSIGNVISLQYDHMDIAKSIRPIKQFMGILERIFKKMSELEYIGLTKENIVVGVDSENVKSSKSEKRWSIFD